MPEGESHAEMIAWCRSDLSWKEHHGWPDDELEKHRAVLAHLERTQPTDTQADMTERVRVAADDVFICVKDRDTRENIKLALAAFAQSEREAALMDGGEWRTKLAEQIGKTQAAVAAARRYREALTEIAEMEGAEDVPTDYQFCKNALAIANEALASPQGDKQ